MSTHNVFPVAELNQRLLNVRSKMNMEDLDGLVVTMPENIYYLTELDHWGFFACHLLIVPIEGDMILVCRKMERITVENQVKNARFFGHADNEELGTQHGGWGWRCDGTLMSLDISKSFGRATVKNGDVAMIAVDMKEGNLWFGLNGEWFDEADPGSGIRPAFTSLAAKLSPSVSSLQGGLGSMVMIICFDASRWQYRPPPGFTSVPTHRS